MKTKIMKFCAWLMAAALAFAGAGAVQAGEVHVSDAAGLKTAFANATADTTIVLDADITTSDATITCPNDCVLDLAGHKISGKRGIKVTSPNSFKLISSVDGGAFDIQGYSAFGMGDDSVAIEVSTSGVITFGDADGKNCGFSVYGKCKGVLVSGSPTIIVNGGTFSNTPAGKMAEGAFSISADSSIVFYGGSVSSVYGSGSVSLAAPDKALACLTSGGSMQLCDIPAEGLDLSYGQVIICVANGKTYKVKQSSAAENKNQLKICAAENTTATVVLDGLCCNNSDTIVCDSGAGSAIVLELDNASTLTGGIRNVGEGELVIQDENGTAGSIKITASGYCAAIGGNQVQSPVGKNITIKSGTIECEAGYGAAIGGGGSSGGNAVNIRILGGTVTAKSDRGAAIGGGNEGHAENVIISGGKVVASSDRGKAVGDGFQSSGSTGISIFCGTYSPAPTADMIAAGYEVIEKGGEFIIGVKIGEATVTTGTQETKVEVPTDVVKDEEVAQKIAQGTKVEGVKLTATDTEQKKGGVQTVVEEAKKDPTFAAAVEVSVKVEVDVEPTEFDNTANKGKVAFKLTPKAVVSVGEGDGKLEREVPVSNDMIDQSQKFAVSIYTGFKPVVITHDADDGSRIETFEGEQISFNEATGFATVLISHFSTVTGFGDAADVPAPKVYVAKVGDTPYETLQEAINAAADGATITLLKDCAASDITSFAGKTELTFEGGTPGRAIIFQSPISGPRSGITTLNFRNLTINGFAKFGLNYYRGWQITNENYEDCTIQNCIDTYSTNCTLKNCLVTYDGNEYALWDYACKNLVLDGCTFDVAGKAVKIYNEGTVCDFNVYSSNCTFKTSEPKKSVFQLDVGHFTNVAAVKIAVDESCTTEGYTESVEGGDPWIYSEHDTSSLDSESKGQFAIGTDIVRDETGKVTGGSFTRISAGLVAEGFVPAVDPDTGKTVVEPDPITGSGTEADPYVISDLKGLEAFRDRVNAGNTYQGKFVKLGDDIDLETVENWEPIGTVQHLFFGTFDGDGNTIRNLKITSGDDKGLFSDGNQPFPGCTIRNLTVDGASVTGGKQCGTIIGGLYCVATLDNVHVKNASVVCTGKRIGGLVSHGYVTFNGCSFEGEVKSTGDTSVGGQVGGLLGAYSVSATNCRVVADVTGSKEVGGIVGNGCESCTFIGNYVKGTITSDVSWWGATGGIAGWGGGVGGTFTIKDNYFDGEVKVAGVKMDAPIIGSLNTTSGSDVEGGDAAAKAAIIEGNSWNTDYYSADIKACAVNADRMPDGNPTQAEIDAVVAAFGKTEPRNNNLVGSVKDLEYVGGGVVEIAAGSVIAEMTPDEIKAKIVEDDPTKTVEITVDGKVVVTENVAEVDGTKYPTLDAALAAATDGATLTLLKDVADIGSKSLNGITFDGNSNKITGASALYCGAEKETTIKNVVFENIHNANSKQSAIYGEGFKTGSITITGCTFDNIDWDAIQIVPADSGVTGSVTIKGNVFRHTDDSLPQLRYIHIQNGGFWTPTLVVTATDNQMYDCEKDITAICVAGFAKGEGSNYSGNYISDVSMIDCSEIQTVKIVDFYPMRTQPTVDVDDLDPKAVFDFTPITTADELVSAINACTTAKPELYFRGDLTAMSPVVLENPNITKIWWYGVATSGTPGFTFRAPSMTTSVPLYLLNNAKIVLDGAFVANGKCEIVSGVYSAESFSGSFEISGGTFNQDISAFVDHRIGRVVDNGDGTWSFEAYTAETALEDGKPFAVASKYYFAHLEEAAQESANIVVIGDACDDADFGAVSPTITLDNMAAFTGSLKSQNQIKINNSKYTEPKAINFTSVTCPVFKYGSSQSWLGEVKIGGGEIGRMEIDSTYTSTTLSGDLKVDEILIATYWYDNKEQKAALTITGGTYGKIQFRANASSEPVGSLPNDAVDLKITNGTFGFDPTAYVDPEISDVVERTTDPVTWEVIEKTSIAAVVSAGGSETNEYKKLSKALEVAQEGQKVILLADTDEENVPLKPDQEIVLNGHAFTGTVDQTNVPEGYDAMVTTPDGRVFSAPAKVTVEIGGGSVIKVRMEGTGVELAEEQDNGRPLWANKALGIANDFKILPVVERPAVGSNTISIKSNIPDSVLEAAARQRDGVSVKFQLAKKVGNVGTYVQFGDKKDKPEFAVEADKQEVQTFWKIQVFFEEEY